MRTTRKGPKSRWLLPIRPVYNAKRQKKQLSRRNSESACSKSLEKVSLMRCRAAAVDGAAADLPKAVAPPVSGLKKGETPQQYVARTIELDLGDF
jgi:RNA polymerase-associated protein RTF1